MALSFILYSGTGGTDTFAVPFGYLKRADVSVELDGIDVTGDVTWLTPASVQLTTTSGTNNVEIRRTTSVSSLEVTFSDGSTPTADELNRAIKQAVYLAQERIDAGLDVTVAAGDVTFGTFAARPAASTADLLYVATDTKQLFRDTGSVWQLLDGALTGVVTKAAGDTVTALGTIPNDSFTYAQLQNVSATDKILGRSTAGAGDIEEITCTATGRSILDDTSVAAVRTTLGVAADACQFLHVHRNGVDQTISDNTLTRINYTTEVFDTGSTNDLTTDRFTPTVAGKYLVIASCGYAGLDSGDLIRSTIIKNGVQVAECLNESTGSNITVQVTAIIAMNGTTDYLEHWTLQDGTGSKDLYGSTDRTFFQAMRISA
jgi:hypothetical protein